jgi:hypothetical protein
MISWEEFQKAMKEVCLLTGQNPPVEQIRAIYQKVKDCDIQDFIQACNDDQFLEEWSYRVNYPSLKRAIERYASARREREAQEAKKREIEELSELLRSEEMPEEVRRFIRGLKKL